MTEDETAGHKRVFVQRLFTSIAPRYDWFNRLASCGLDQRWRRQALALARLEPQMRLLDLCTGTGDLALLASARLRGDGIIIGMDMNPAMLAYARQKRPRRQADVRWMQGDAQALPFRDGAFDRVVIGFSTRNLSDLTAGLREMIRVLRPGGQLVILETGRPSNPLLRWGYQTFLLTVARAIGVVLTGRLWPFTYLARSVQRFLSPVQMLTRLQECETQAAYVPLAGGLASLYLATKPNGSS